MLKTDGVTLSFSAVRETLFRTTLNNAAPGKRVNLERAMQLGGRLDGHIVQGHVDISARLSMTGMLRQYFKNY